MKIESTIGAKAGGYVDKWIKWAGGGNIEVTEGMRKWQLTLRAI